MLFWRKCNYFCFYHFYTLVKISNCFLFDVTEQGNPTQDPVVWWLDCRQHHCCDVVQVCARWLLVDGAHIKLRMRRGSGVDSKHVNDRQGCKQHFGWGLDETGVLSVPASTINVQTIDINSLLLKKGSQWQDSPLFYSLYNKKKNLLVNCLLFTIFRKYCILTHCWWGCDLLLCVLEYFVVECDRVQSPAFVRSGYFLPHGCQKSCKHPNKDRISISVKEFIPSWW